MARKKKNVEEVKEIASQEEILEVQDEINEELIKEQKLKEKEKKKNSSYLFFTFFIKRLKEDKIYLFSFIVTAVFLGFFSFKKLQATEGYYDKKNESKTNENVVVPTINPDLNNQNKNDKTGDALDISDYVGIYSKEVTMNAPAVINKTCSISSYKVVYQIKKDKSISKYFINDCIGTIKIWDSKLDYVSSGGARYISANSINYLFSNSSMKEVDGDTFKLDDDINTIKVNKKIDNVEVSFLDSNVVFVSNNDLISIKGNNINYQLSEKYKINTNVLDKIVYNSSVKNQFKFIIFEDKEEKKCYTKEEISADNFTDGKIYTIYSVKYNEESKIFDAEKEIVSRNKSDGCDVYNEDFANLEE